MKHSLLLMGTGIIAFFQALYASFRQRKLWYIVIGWFILLCAVHFHVGGILFIFPDMYEQIIERMHVCSDSWAFFYDMVRAILYIAMSFALTYVYWRSHAQSEARATYLLATLGCLAMLALIGALSTFVFWELIGFRGYVLFRLASGPMLLLLYLFMCAWLETAGSYKKSIAWVIRIFQSYVAEIVGWLGAYVLLLQVMPYLFAVFMTMLQDCIFGKYLLYVGAGLTATVYLLAFLLSPLVLAWYTAHAYQNISAA